MHVTKDQEEQVNTMENLSQVFQKQKRKKNKQIEFNNSIQDLAFTTVYRLKKSAWKNAWHFIVNLHSLVAPVSSKDFLDIQTTMECRFHLKRLCDMIITYRQMHHTDKYLQHSSIIQPVWLNGCVFIYKLSGCGFKYCCCHLNFRYCTCFKQGIP